MGGHGALVAYLRQLNDRAAYRSVSAFAPIANPTRAPWGEKAFSGYLKGGVKEGEEWDATLLLEKAAGKNVNVLVDVVRFKFPLPSTSLAG